MWQLRYTADDLNATILLNTLVQGPDADNHGMPYPEAVGSWGPNVSGACTAKVSTLLPRDGGYVFEYRGVPPSSTLQGCTRFKGFVMTARPVTFGKTGIRSCYMSNQDHVRKPARCGHRPDSVPGAQVQSAVRGQCEPFTNLDAWLATGLRGPTGVTSRFNSKSPARAETCLKSLLATDHASARRSDIGLRRLFQRSRDTKTHLVPSLVGKICGRASVS